MLDFLRPWAKEEMEDIKQDLKNPSKSFAPPENSDGASVRDATFDPRLGHMAGMNGFSSDFDKKVKSTEQLIKQYRSIAHIHEVDDAIQEIVDDAIVYEDGKPPVWIDLDQTNFSSTIKQRITDEFNNIVNLYDFKKKGSQLFRHWYVDSRIYFHKIIDQKTGELKELRRLDPLRLELVREDIKENQGGVDVVVASEEYYLYRSGDKKYCGQSIQGQTIKIPKEALVFVFSGLVDNCGDNTNIIGYLQRAIKPANQLKMLEDALVIYRMTRAPERRVFYVDVGNMPNRKAQQYVNNIMQGLKNRVVYDSSTGKAKNSSNNMSMLEDFYLPRRDGSKGTEVTTLPAGQNLGDIDDVMYFNKKLYRSLYVPPSRSQDDQQQGVSFGGGAEISRDELRFAKFIRRLQNRFEEIFTDPLKYVLVQNKVITEEEWEENVENIDVIFQQDSYYEEQKDLELLNSRMSALQQAEAYIGKYFSNAWTMKNILRMSDEEVEAMNKEIDEESKDSRFSNNDEEF